MSAPEFSHLLRLDCLGTAAEPVELIANEAEREAVARRFDLISLDELKAKLSVVREGEHIRANGSFSARLSQACVASAQPVPDRLDEQVSIRFAPPVTALPDAEIELSDDDCDVMEYEGSAIDLAEAIAQSLGLALNPYPRSPTADATLKAAGVKSESEAGAFAGLAALRDKLGNG